MAAQEQKVLELVEKSEFYDLFKYVKMEDAMNVFYTEEEHRQMYQPRSVVWTFNQGLSKTSPDEGFGYWIHNQWSDHNMTHTLAVKVDVLIASVKAFFQDPNAKLYPFDLPAPFLNESLISMNPNTRELGFGYSAAKGGFVRKEPKAAKTKLGKAPVNDMQRVLAAGLVDFLQDEAGLRLVRISATGSKPQMHNAVVVQKMLGTKLSDFENLDEHYDRIAKYHELNDKLKAELKKVATKWWDDCKEFVKTN